MTAIESPKERSIQAGKLAKSFDWQEFTIQTDIFPLKAYGSRVKNQKILTIYIEGDGFAWISENRPSTNPTPRVATGLKMAIKDKSYAQVAYLARPCQFELSSYCKPIYWTNRRFSPEIVDAMNQGVDYLKKYYQAQQIKLIGYSGGGTIASLLSARRTDVIRLVTVAAVLDVKEWVWQLNLTPLSGSLDPADEWSKLVSLPQTHWVGGKDRIVPKEVAYAFANHFPANKKPTIFVMPDFDHACCWAEGGIKY